MAEKTKKKPHAIMISMPYQGHITPFVSLALNLASNGIAVTFVHLESIHNKLSKSHRSSQIQADPFADARDSGLDIRYATIGDGFPLEYDRDTRPEKYWTALVEQFPPLVDEFVGKMIRSDPDLLHFLVADTSYAWPAAVAQKYNLVNVSFWASPASVFSLLYHLELLKEKGHFLFKGENAEIDYIPGVKPIRSKDLMSSLTKPLDITGNFLFKAFEAVKKADFILHNTVEELEPETLSSLNKYQPTYAVGPIHFTTTATAAVTKSLHSEVDITRWLDFKPPGSVLYVSFGSVVQTSREVIEEMAYGLLESGVNFIWVVRAHLTNSNNGNVLPEGFEEGVRGRGLVVTWCDQIGVLSNAAVGGFLTHCGWNSTVESLWCGVPMICFPVTYDQPTNRKLVVEDWGVGVDLCDGMAVDRRRVAEKIKGFMSGSEVMKRKAEEVEEIVHGAIESGGSSRRNFDQFIVDLRKKLFG